MVYDAICKVLSDRQEQACTEHGRSVAWEQFGPAEWQLLPRMAVAEGVAPLLYRKLGRTEDGAQGTELPTATLQSLRASYYRTAAQKALLFWELDQILEAFEQANIPVVLLKGAALAQTVYANIGLRPMGDLDLLALQKQLEQSV